MVSPCAGPGVGPIRGFELEQKHSCGHSHQENWKRLLVLLHVVWGHVQEQWAGMPVRALRAACCRFLTAAFCLSRAEWVGNCPLQPESMGSVPRPQVSPGSQTECQLNRGQRVELGFSGGQQANLVSFSTTSAFLQSKAGCHGTLGNSPEFSSPFLALVAVGYSLTPLGTARFSLVLPGQTISSRKRAQLRSLGK